MNRRPKAEAKCRIGILGAGDIAGRYIDGLRLQKDFEIIAVASRTFKSATEIALQKGLRATSTDNLLADDEIDLILNLTPPAFHFNLTQSALQSGKHVYSEKPLATSLAEADLLIALADQRGLMLACAPATFMGPVWSSARSLIRQGALGRIVGATGTLVYPGPNLFHHNPEHLFSKFGGPVFDMGVYHISVLVSLLGGINKVQAMKSAGQDQRSILAGPRTGQTFPVTVPTHVACTLSFASGAVANLTLSFEGFGSRAPGLEIIGDRGAICLPQAGQFAGEILISSELFKWTVIEQAADAWSDRDWVIGPVEAWRSFLNGRQVGPSAERARHTLDVLLAIEAAARRGLPQTVISGQLIEFENEQLS